LNFSREQRAITEVDVRAMRHRARSFAPSVVLGRFMIDTTHAGDPGSSSARLTTPSNFSSS
jgi:hypothetical protein